MNSDRPPETAQATRTSLRWLRLTLTISVPLCVGIAGFFSLMLGDPFGTALVYSLCIGLIVQLLIQFGRFALARRLRRSRPDSLAAQSPWPGWGLMAPWVIGSALVGYYAGSSLADVLVGAHPTHTLFSGDLRPLVRALGATVLASVGVTYVFYARGHIAAIEVHAQAVQRNAVETRLKLLESQLEPHMLFNTLSNLRVLIGTDPPRAQLMLDRLIAFLRATLSASRATLHPLSAEFARVQDYLDLMKIRMAERLQTQLDLPADLAGCRVPPLLLQPLVENAIKHGLEPNVRGGRLTVSAERDGIDLVLRVRNTGGEAAAPAGDTAGFGLKQVRERLATLYGAAARLELAAAGDEGGMLATVRLPCDDAAAPP